MINKVVIFLLFVTTVGIQCSMNIPYVEISHNNSIKIMSLAELNNVKKFPFSDQIIQSINLYNTSNKIVDYKVNQSGLGETYVLMYVANIVENHKNFIGRAYGNIEVQALRMRKAVYDGKRNDINEYIQKNSREKLSEQLLQDDDSLRSIFIPKGMHDNSILIRSKSTLIFGCYDTYSNQNIFRLTLGVSAGVMCAVGLIAWYTYQKYFIK